MDSSFIKMKVIRFILFITMLFCTLSSSAEDINALMLHLASGKQVVCLLDEKPLVTFSGGDLELTTHMNKVSYQSADVLKFTYLYADPSGISQVELSHNMFSLSENRLSFTGLEPDTNITVYTAEGILVASAKTNNNGAASITLPEQSGKVYIVSTSVANFKITKP